MNSKLLAARQTRYAAYATLYLLVFVTSLVIVNILADRHNKTYDSTSNKRYSLSAQTAKIVKGLQQPATVTYFDQSTRFEQARDQLEQYAGLSPKLRVEYVDPDKKPELARAAGVKNYGTTIVQIGERREEAKSLTEEGITGAFIRDLKATTRTVCFVEGSGEHQIEDADRNGYSRFKELLGKDGYEATAVNLVTRAQFPSPCTVGVVGGPDADYQQPEIDALRKYVEGGGRALILLDPPLKIGREEIADNDAFGKVLAGWGVTLEKNL